MTIDSSIRFCTTDWSVIQTERREGTTGYALWRVQHFGSVRVRMVEYSANYFADHWCEKGHIIFCVDGAMTTELEDGRKFELTQGMSYQVGDHAESHRSFSKDGAKLFIVD